MELGEQGAGVGEQGAGAGEQGAVFPDKARSLRAAHFGFFFGARTGRCCYLPVGSGTGRAGSPRLWLAGGPARPTRVRDRG